MYQTCLDQVRARIKELQHLEKRLEQAVEAESIPEDERTGIFDEYERLILQGHGDYSELGASAMLDQYLDKMKIKRPRRS